MARSIRPCGDFDVGVLADPSHKKTTGSVVAILSRNDRHRCCCPGDVRKVSQISLDDCLACICDSVSVEYVRSAEREISPSTEFGLNNGLSAEFWGIQLRLKLLRAVSTELFAARRSDGQFLRSCCNVENRLSRPPRVPIQQPS